MLPVIYLVMQRHYAILALTSDYVLEENAMERASHTIDCITDLLFNRAVHLRGTMFRSLIDEDVRLTLAAIENFSKLQYDVDRKIQYVANGMVRASVLSSAAFLNSSRAPLTVPGRAPIPLCIG